MVRGLLSLCVSCVTYNPKTHTESQNTQRQRTKRKNKEKRENGKRTSLCVCVVCDLQSKNTHRIPKTHKDKELKKK